MWKCEVRSETEGKLFDGRPGFVLGRGERDVLVLMEEKGRELIGVWREKKVVHRGDVKRVWKDEEVVRVAGQLEECVLGVLMEMMGLGLVGNGGKSVFVCGLACLGLNLKDGGWKEVDGCTQVCAAVLTIGKLFVLYDCWLKRKKEVDYLMVERGMSEDDVELEVDGLVERLNEQAKKYFLSKVIAVKGKVRVMELLMDWISYGKAIKMREKSWQTKVQWLRDLDGVAVGLFKKSVRLRMDGVKGMVWDLLGDLEEKMKSELLFVSGWDLEREGLMVDMNSLVDDWRRKAIGYSFVTDERNGGEHGGVLKLDGSRWLLRRVMGEKKLRGLFMVRSVVDGREEWDFDRGKWDVFARKVKGWKECFLILVHLTGGGPGRANEVLSVRRRNGETMMRNVFVDDGMVSLVVGYVKGSSKSMKGSTVMRFLPERVGRLMVWYLWLLCPFVEMLQMRVKGVKRIGEFVWEAEPEVTFGQVWEKVGWSGEIDLGGEDEGQGKEGRGKDEDEDDDELSGENERFRDEEDDGWDESGGVVRKVWEREIMFDKSDGEDESDVEDVGFGRMGGGEGGSSGGGRGKGKKEKVRCLEVDGYWNGRRFGMVFRRESKKRMGQDMGLSVWRDAYVGFHRRNVRDGKVGSMLVRMDEGGLGLEDGGKVGGDEMEEYRSKQLAHSRRVELNAYAGSNMELQFGREDERSLFRKVSEDWHMVLGLKSRGERVREDVMMKKMKKKKRMGKKGL
jgi:hypothetical protein